jgi:predicted transcriptional regulator of viral defense system
VKYNAFLARHPVFRHEEFAAHVAAGPHPPPSARAVENILAHHVRAGGLARVRRGVYFTVPVGVEADRAPVDSFLVAAHLTEDAVLAYHAALQLHGVAYSVVEDVTYCTTVRTRPLTFRGQRYRPLPFPKPLRDAGKERFAVETVDRQGLDVRVTNLERTLVDALDRPDETGGWEEVWRSLEAVPYVNPDVVIDYALLLGSVTTNAKLGFFLDQHRNALLIDDVHLDRLAEHLPAGPHYLTHPDRRPGKYIARWRLVVPIRFLARSWDEGEGEFGEFGDAIVDEDASGVPTAAAGAVVR